MTGRLTIAAAVASLAGCTHLGGHGPVPDAHYVVGAPYQADGIWRYPRQTFEGEETGLAAVEQRRSGVTADGEMFDPSLLTAAAPTLQLPCIVRVTNLDNGAQIVVRVNDRGPERRGRLLALSPRAAALLGAAGRPALRVRVTVMEAESRQLAAALNGGDAPVLNVARAPKGEFRAEPLPPPAGATQASLTPGRPALPTAPPHIVAIAADAPVPLRLPEQVAQVPPRPGALWIEAGAFGRLEYAELLRVKLASLGARTATSYDAPRDRAYRVRIGPLADVAAADAMLDRTIHAGISDARIVAE